MGIDTSYVKYHDKDYSYVVGYRYDEIEMVFYEWGDTHS